MYRRNCPKRLPLDLYTFNNGWPPLHPTSDIFRKAVNGIIRLARDYCKPRFDAEQVSDIKSALNLFGDDRQSHQAAGDFLYITATQKGKLDNREQIKARREVDNVVEGHYDQQQKRGFSIRR